MIYDNRPNHHVYDYASDEDESDDENKQPWDYITKYEENTMEKTNRLYVLNKCTINSVTFRINEGAIRFELKNTPKDFDSSILWYSCSSKQHFGVISNYIGLYKWFNIKYDITGRILIIQGKENSHIGIKMRSMCICR